MPRRPDMPPLHRSALADDPIEQFRDWYEQAEREVPLAQAMTLATVDADGAPDARMVLLKGFGPNGFRFFTNLSISERGAAGGDAPGGAGALLARARPPGADPRTVEPFPRRSRTSTSRPARARLRSEPGLRPRASRCPTARRSTLTLTRWRSGSPATRSRAHRSGAASRSDPSRSSSGRDRQPASTTASCTRARAMAGGWSGWRHSQSFRPNARVHYEHVFAAVSHIPSRMQELARSNVHGRQSDPWRLDGPAGP